jgi:soluble lytic murein transglycosylase
LNSRPSKSRVLFLTLLLGAALGALALPFCTASCSTQVQTKPGEADAIERLRALIHTSAPSEQAIAQLESDYANTRAGALARLAHARLRLAAGDPNATATLLNDKLLARATSIGDYALLMRAQALVQAGRRAEARAAYEQLARDYPASIRAREAMLRDADLALQDGQAAAVPALLKKLIDADDSDALFLAAQAYERQGDAARARAAYRRIAIFAPVAPELLGSAPTLQQPLQINLPADILVNPNPTAEELTTRAEKLAQAKRYSDAADTYKQLFASSPNAATPQLQLHYGIAAFNTGRTPEAIAALSAVPTSAHDVRAEALFYLAQTQARAKQWAQARAAADELRRAFPQDMRGVRALVAAGLAARDAKLTMEAANFFRAAVAAAPGAVEVAQAQFELAWAAHEAKNYQESSKLLLEHLAVYAGLNTDNRGRAGYWAGRDLERAGRIAEARAIYQALLQRYDANWYGALARRRLDAMPHTANDNKTFAPDDPVSRATANLNIVSVAEETAGTEADMALRKADELNVVGLDDYALDELNLSLQSAPHSPRLNLAKARVYRSRNAHDDNLQALLTLQKSYPDYSQMKPEELTREEWDAFYPLSNWDTIKQEARAHNLDPYTVAGLIRQESVFDPHAKSPANAYGLMQLLLDTAQRTAHKYSLPAPTSVSELYDPQLNIKLGTAYLRDQLDRFGRIEYVAAAYNAGPGRAERWIAELPQELDEWAEAVPFKETRSYVQGVVRNTLQYRRLYDEDGHFRQEVGMRAVRSSANANADNANTTPANGSVRPRRVIPDEQPEQEQ